MERLNLSIGDKAYPILMGESLLTHSGLWADLIHNRAACLITDEHVAALIPLNGGIPASVARLVLPAGEVHKNLQTLSTLLGFLTESHFPRDGVLIALGGGVIGDIVGFAAAIYQRGIEFIQVPTTTLAMLDSSIGGKTAVNFGSAKNNIGAFHQPAAVVMDLTCLKALPEREYVAGLVEAIKHGLIWDTDFFNWIAEHRAALLKRDPSSLRTLIKRSCTIKAEIVAQDEKEQGLRMILNFGHTFGHALEAYSDYQDFKHGEAVAIGILCALRLSPLEDQALLTKTEYLFEQLGLPTRLPSHYNHDKLIALMQHDKKKRQGQLNFILLKSAGNAIIQQEDLCKIRF